MFTGIVEEIGEIVSLYRTATANVLTIKGYTALGGTNIGDSIAVNGVCLTVTTIKQNIFTVDVMPETFRRTNLVTLRAGAHVNLERALAVGGRVGGHFVTGHIDGTGTIVDRKREHNAIIVTIECNHDILQYTVEKGSIAVDGISLTIGGIEKHSFWISLIPHTIESTTLRHKQIGHSVNLEADILGKYVGKMLNRERFERRNGITLEKLKELNF